MAYKKIELTEEQKEFILKNYKRVTEPKMAKIFNLPSRFAIQRFKRENKLSKYKANIKKSENSCIVKEGYFNVEKRECWII